MSRGVDMKFRLVEQKEDYNAIKKALTSSLCHVKSIEETGEWLTIELEYVFDEILDAELYDTGGGTRLSVDHENYFEAFQNEILDRLLEVDCEIGTDVCTASIGGKKYVVEMYEDDFYLDTDNVEIVDSGYDGLWHINSYEIDGYIEGTGYIYLREI